MRAGNKFLPTGKNGPGSKDNLIQMGLAMKASICMMTITRTKAHGTIFSLQMSKIKSTGWSRTIQRRVFPDGGTTSWTMIDEK